MGSLSPSSSRALRLVPLAALVMAGCEWPRMSPENSLANLVPIRGQALLPMDYVVAADSLPAPRTFRATLVTLGGETLAVGTILDTQGNFSVHVPANLLSAQGAIYEVDLIDPARTATYRSLVRLAARYPEAAVTVNGASSTIALAAREALRQGRDPSKWPLESLLTDPQIRKLGLQYANQLARWSNGPAIASGPPIPAASSLEQVMAIAALL